MTGGGQRPQEVMWPGHMRSMASPVLPKAGGIDRCHPVSMGGSSCPELTRGQARDPTLSMCQWTVPVGGQHPVSCPPLCPSLGSICGAT